MTHDVGEALVGSGNAACHPGDSANSDDNHGGQGVRGCSSGGDSDTGHDGDGDKDSIIDGGGGAVAISEEDVRDEVTGVRHSVMACEDGHRAAGGRAGAACCREAPCGEEGGAAVRRRGRGHVGLPGWPRVLLTQPPADEPVPTAPPLAPVRRGAVVHVAPAWEHVGPPVSNRTGSEAKAREPRDLDLLSLVNVPPLRFFLRGWDEVARAYL